MKPVLEGTKKKQQVKYDKLSKVRIQTVYVQCCNSTNDHIMITALPEVVSSFKEQL